MNLICYLETQNAFVIFEGLAARKLIKATAKLPDVYQGKEVHTGFPEQREENTGQYQCLPWQNYFNLNKDRPKGWFCLYVKKF